MTYESTAIAKGQAGESFVTTAPVNKITALASHYKRKVSTKSVTLVTKDLTPSCFPCYIITIIE